MGPERSFECIVSSGFKQVLSVIVELTEIGSMKKRASTYFHRFDM